MYAMWDGKLVHGLGMQAMRAILDSSSTVSPTQPSRTFDGIIYQNMMKENHLQRGPRKGFMFRVHGSRNTSPRVADIL